MIYSTLENSNRIENVHPGIQKLFNFIRQNGMDALKEGRNEIDGDNLFVNNVSVNLKTREEQIMEAHQVYIDVHIPLSGTEIFGVIPTSDCQSVQTPYNDEKDVIFFHDRGTNYINVKPGEFVIVFPEDAHSPNIGEGKLHKLVAKIKI